jgi:hypothetical protein
MRFHDLRLTAATHILANGIDMLTVSLRLGHTRASATLDTYTHMVSGTQEKAAALMDEITTPVSLPTGLIFPKELVAPGLHRESYVSLDRPE